MDLELALEDQDGTDQPLDDCDESLGKASPDVSSPNPFALKFVPVVWTLPIKNFVEEKPRGRQLTRQPDKEAEKRNDSMMSDGGLYKAEVVFIKDQEEAGSAGNTRSQRKPAGQMILPPPFPSIRFSAQAENTAPREVSEPAVMDITVGKLGGISQQQSPSPPIDSLYPACESEADRVSPPNSVDLFPTPASSRESILSEGWDQGWDRDRSWPGLPLSPEPSSHFSLSRTVSPCSSVRSGMFTPTVVRLRRHALAPGSSLLHIASSDPTTGDSPPRSPLTPHARHRPPPTRLSLLTAILRKGRLPVLSSSFQRPYTPCWPINQLSLSTCKACSAASSLASMAPLASTHSPAHSHSHGDGCVVAPPGGVLLDPQSCPSPGPPPTSPHRHSEEQESHRRGTSWRGISSPLTPALTSPTPTGPTQSLPLFSNLPKSPLPPATSPFLHGSSSSSSSSFRSLSQPPKPATHPQTFVAQIYSPPPYSPAIRTSPLMSSENKPINLQQDRKHQTVYPPLHTSLPDPPLHSSQSKLCSSVPQLINTTGTPLAPVSSLGSLSSPWPCSSLPRLYTTSPTPSSVSSTRCSSAQSPPASSPAPDKLSPASPPPPPPASSPAPAQPPRSYSHTITTSSQRNGRQTTPSQSLQNGVSNRPQWSRAEPRSSTASPAHTFLPRSYCLSPSRYTPLLFPGSLSPEPDSHQPSPPATPDCLTLSPSPLPPSRALTLSPSPSPLPPSRALTLSPSLSSLRSTPSPRPGSALSECSDREGIKRKPHKIKLSYKALAAIPTNTLLLEQQAIDEQVERHGEQLLEEDPHSEMCSPAQLRQQSEELYATIDKVLEDPTPLRQPSPVFRNSRERLDRGVTKHYTSSPRSMGRETKYATHNIQPLSPEPNQLDPNKTKPGVIRPLNIGTRLMLHNEDDDDDDNEDYHRNPFRQYMEDLSNNGHSKSTHPIMTIHENEAMISRGHENIGLENKASLCPGWSGGQEGSGKITPESRGSMEPLSLSALMMAESERSHSCSRADRVWQRTPTFCCPAKPQTELFETHI